MTDNVQKAYKFFQKYPGHLKTATDEIAERLDISYEDVSKGRKIYREDNKEEGTKTVSNANEGVHQRVEEEDAEEEFQEFLEKHGIDPDDVTNVWFKQKANGTHFSVETRKYKDDFDDDFDPTEAFRESIEEYTPSDYSHLFSKSSQQKKRCAVISLFDAHLDKIALPSETDDDADIKSNIQLFESAFDDLLMSIASKDPEIILFPVGNDFWHTNDAHLTTKKGTPMSDRVHTTDMEAFRMGLNLIRRCIDKARQVCNVFIIPVRGNHDYDRVNYLLECLLVAYENQPDIGILDSRKSRLYYRYGKWLFGFAHGDKNRKAAELPSLMSTDADARPHWGDIDQGVFFLGDIHHERRFNFVQSQDFRGCKVMFLRSVGPDDEWHWSEGYSGIPKTAYAFIYDKDGRRDQEFKVNI